MLKRLFKGLVVMAGAGLLLRAGHRRLSTISGELAENPEAVPLDFRLQRIETRLLDLETPSGVDGAIANGTSPDLLELRDLIQAVDRRNGEQITAMSLRLDDLQENLPRSIDLKINAKVSELEQRLKVEIAESCAQAVRTLVEAFEPRMLQAVSGIEASLVDQGEQIVELRNRLGKTDGSLAKILTTVERLAASPETRYPVYANGDAAMNGH